MTLNPLNERKMSWGGLLFSIILILVVAYLGIKVMEYTLTLESKTPDCIEELPNGSVAPCAEEESEMKAPDYSKEPQWLQDIHENRANR